jgi:hypothetical protein
MTGRLEEWEIKTKKGKRKKVKRRGERKGCNGKERAKNWKVCLFYI